MLRQCPGLGVRYNLNPIKFRLSRFFLSNEKLYREFLQKPIFAEVRNFSYRNGEEIKQFVSDFVLFIQVRLGHSTDFPIQIYQIFTAAIGQILFANISVIFGKTDQLNDTNSL